MDTTREIVYRGFTLNPDDGDLEVTGGGAAGTGLVGCKVDSFDMSDVDVVQWSEKRSQADGNDAGDVMLGARRIRMSGTLYGLTRNTLYDDLFTLRAALNPVLAQREEPLDYGYRPLYFAVPTNRSTDYPTGAIELMVRALPRAFQQVTRDDEQGGEDDDALAIPWNATWLCKDPGIYSADPVTVNLSDTTATEVSSGVTSVNATDIITKANHGLTTNDRITFSSLTGGTGLSTGVAYWVIATNLTTNTFMLSATQGGATVNHTTNITAATYIKSSTVSGNWTNRGTYLGAFNGLFVVGAGAGSIVGTIGDSVFTITVPASTGQRIIRVKDDKTVTFEENSVEVTNMGAIAFTGDTTYPLMDPGETPYSLTFHGLRGVVTGSRFWMYEQYA